MQIEPVPPPSYVCMFYHYASAFFLGVLFTLGAASVATTGAVTSADFFEVDLFNRAFIAFLLLDTPKEPIVRFPFFDFLSPRPMYSK
jgi:hypothetical protein